MSSIYNPLFGKKVVIFGGSSGIGYAVAEHSLDKGAKVFIGSSNASKVEQAVESLKKLFPQGSVSGKAVNLTSEESVTEYLRWVDSEGAKGVDHIVYTAGDPSSVSPTNLSETKVDSYKDKLEVQYWGAVRVAKAALPFWNEGASLTLTSGIAAFTPTKNWMVAAGMASGSIGLARGMAVDFSPKVRCNCVVLGAVKTPLWETFGSAEEVKPFMKKFADMALTKTVANPREIAHAYIYMMSCSFADGSTLVVDGGAMVCKE